MGGENKIVFDSETRNEFIDDYKNKILTLAEIGEKYNISNATIDRLLLEFEVERSRKTGIKTSMPDQAKCVKMVNAGMSTTDIAKEIGITRTAVCKIKNKYSLGHSGRYGLNRSAFLHDDEKAMYFAGLLMADGSVCMTGSGNWNVYLNSIDMDVLEKFRDYLGDKSRPISKCGAGSRVQVSNAVLVKRLKGFGVVPQKTFIAKIPSENIVLNRHFWRGFIDGDGWYIWNNRNTAQVGIGSASLDLIKQFIVFLDHHGLYKKNKIYERQDTQNPFYSYVVRGAEAFDLIDILYFNSSVHMDRKREKAMEFMCNRNRW